jgi:hypothetical protein
VRSSAPTSERPRCETLAREPVCGEWQAARRRRRRAGRGAPALRHLRPPSTARRVRPRREPLERPPVPVPQLQTRARVPSARTPRARKGVPGCTGQRTGRRAASTGRTSRRKRQSGFHGPGRRRAHAYRRRMAARGRPRRAQRPRPRRDRAWRRARRLPRRLPRLAREVSGDVPRDEAPTPLASDARRARAHRAPARSPRRAARDRAGEALALRQEVARPLAFLPRHKRQTCETERKRR